MEFLTLDYYIFLVLVIMLYYIFPVKKRWYVLLIGSMFFYWRIAGISILVLVSLGGISYAVGLCLYDGIITKRILSVAICVVVLPLYVVNTCILVY